MQELTTREELLRAVQELRADLERAISDAGESRMEQPGSFGPWTFKDLIAHLTGWRLLTAVRLEAGSNGIEPAYPWPAHLDEADDLDDINRWFFETNRDKSLEEVLAESQATFDRVEHAIAVMPEDDLLEPGRVAWLDWTDQALGPAMVRGSQNHYYIEHEPAIRAWLSEK